MWRSPYRGLLQTPGHFMQERNMLAALSVCRPGFTRLKLKYCVPNVLAVAGLQ